MEQSGKAEVLNVTESTDVEEFEKFVGSSGRDSSVSPVRARPGEQGGGRA